MFAAATFKGKSVGVFGLARSGIACATALKLGGATVFAWDDSEPAVAKALAEGIAISNLHQVDFKSLDALVLSPGVPLTHPEPHWSVVKAKQAGIGIISDTEIFAREAAAGGAKLVAITGTNGKSTTTALIGHVLKSAGLDVDVGGNIGLAVFNLREPRNGRICVLELSSFQIDLMPSLKPDVGILTNITPDHLDRHGTMENYATVKGRMFEKMAAGDTALISVDDPWCVDIADDVSSATTLRRISVVAQIGDGICAPDGILTDVQNNQTVTEIDLRGFQSLKGRHNWQNACMAYGAARALGLDVASIAKGMASFPGLEHRMQQVGKRDLVSFINDSKATNADAAEKALRSFRNIHWIAGGIAKEGGIEPLRPLFGNITKAYLIGAAAGDFATTLEGNVSYEIVETLERAVIAAADDAAKSSTETTVLLSPACASFDHYKNFEVRGDAFVAAVSRLPGIEMTVPLKGAA